MNLQNSNHLTTPEIVKKLNISRGTFDSWVTRGKFNEAIVSRRGDNGNRFHIFDYDKVLEIIRLTTRFDVEQISEAPKEKSKPKIKEIQEKIEDVIIERSENKSTQSNTKKIPGHSEAKAMTDIYKFQLTKLEYEQKIGQLVDAVKVKRAFFNAARIVRNSLLAVSGRVASEIAAMSDDKEIEQLIQNEILQSLEGLQNVSLAEC